MIWHFRSFHIGMRVNVLQMVQQIPLQAAKLEAWSCKVLSALNAYWVQWKLGALSTSKGFSEVAQVLFRE